MIRLCQQLILAKVVAWYEVAAVARSNKGSILVWLQPSYLHKPGYYLSLRWVVHKRKSTYNNHLIFSRAIDAELRADQKFLKLEAKDDSYEITLKDAKKCTGNIK